MWSKLKLKWNKFIENVQAGNKKSRRWLIIDIGILLFVVIGVIGIIRMNMPYRSYEVLNVIDKNDDVSVNYQVIGDGLIRYSKDGAAYTDKRGKTLWNQTFEMANAAVSSCKDYMAIGDIGSNQIRIFNQAGQIGMINALYPVSAIEVAKQGVVAAILSDSEQSFINLYDSEGSDLVSIKASISKTGYPIDIALSEDATKLAVSYVTVNDGHISSQIVFYKFGKASQASEDSVVGTYHYEAIYPKVEFINNNTLVAFGENGFEIYSMKNTPEVILEKTFPEPIKSIFYNEQYIGFVFKNDESLNNNAPETAQAAAAVGQSPAGDTAQTAQPPSGDSVLPEAGDTAQTSGETGGSGESRQESKSAGSNLKYRMLVYTNSGALYLDKQFDFDYHVIECSNNEIIMYNEFDCLMLDYKGKEKFKYTFENQIYNLLPKESRNEYILVDNNTIQEIRLK